MVGVKKGLRGLERWMEGWNREGGREEEGVRCVELRRTGYLCLDIQIPDPQLRVLDREEDDEEEGMPARLGAVDGGRGGESL